MLTGPLCLAETGLDPTGLIIAGVLALVFIALGILAVRRGKGVAAFLLVPLAVVALLFGGSAAPAQAVEAKIADFVASENWTEDGLVYVSDAPSAENLATLQELEEFITEEATFSLTLFSEDGTEQVALDPSDASAPVGTGIAEVDGAAVDLAQDELEEPYGELGLVYSITFAYLDRCGNPLTTTVTWEGTVFFPGPIE